LSKSEVPSYSYQVGSFLGRLIFSSVGSKIIGKENVPRTGSVLLVSNHQSFLDPMFVSLTCPKRHVHFMAKEELFRTPTTRHLMLGLGAFPVNRNGPTKATLAHVLKLLRNGQCVCLFAEGTRSRDGELQPFQAGFARIAKKTNTPVVPIGLMDSRYLFESLQGASLPIWSKLIGTPAPAIAVGRPISPDLPVTEIANQTHDSVRRLIEECRASYANPRSK
jgi:1-acyl-sn-glycerol-3-phosphate acyltransferase